MPPRTRRTYSTSADPQEGQGNVEPTPREQRPTASVVEMEGEDYEDVVPEDLLDDPLEEQAPPGSPARRSPGVIRPTMEQDDADDLQELQELEELRRWRKKALLQAELESLRAMKARYDTGDLTALQVERTGRTESTLTPTAPSQSLPRPEAPEKYTRRNRAEFNRWERDCELYFKRSPNNFPGEDYKIDFGLGYVSEPLKSLWSAHASPERLVMSWQPTWKEFKTVMLNALGTPQERQQLAYDAIRDARQRPNQSPTDLLDYLRPHWEELGDLHGPAMKVFEFTGALREEIKKDLIKLPLERRNTLPLVEESANIIHRQNIKSRPPKEQAAKKTEVRPREKSSGTEGTRKPHKKAKNATLGHTSPKWQASGVINADRPKLTCYNCKQVGHIKPNCPSLTKPTAGPSGTQEGKGKGWKV